VLLTKAPRSTEATLPSVLSRGPTVTHTHTKHASFLGQCQLALTRAKWMVYAENFKTHKPELYGNLP
jgi:hypothetical protein